MQAQEAIDARQTAEAARRGGGEDDPPPENENDVMRGTAASSSSGAIGHINSEEAESSTGRAALAPRSRAASAPIKENGSAGSAPAPVVAFTLSLIHI